MITFDLETAEILLKEVVAGKEDFVYEKPRNSSYCKYSEGENCDGCGIGQVFRKLGVTEEQLEYLDGCGTVNSFRSDNEVVVFADPSVRVFLAGFQYSQDRKKTWGESLDDAYIALKHFKENQ